MNFIATIFTSLAQNADDNEVKEIPNENAITIRIVSIIDDNKFNNIVNVKNGRAFNLKDRQEKLK